MWPRLTMRREWALTTRRLGPATYLYGVVLDRPFSMATRELALSRIPGVGLRVIGKGRLLRDVRGRVGRAQTISTFGLWPATQVVITDPVAGRMSAFVNLRREVHRFRIEEKAFGTAVDPHAERRLIGGHPCYRVRSETKHPDLVEEVWISEPLLNVVIVERRLVDGLERRYEATEIQIVEPDPSEFQVPDDYVVFKQWSEPDPLT